LQRRHPEAQDLVVELARLLRVVDHPGDVAEFQRTDAVVRQVLAHVVPLFEQRDRGALVVLKRKHRAYTGDRVVAQLALDAFLLQFARQLAEVGIGRYLERQRGAALGLTLVKLDGEEPDLRSKEGAILLALGKHEPHHVGVIVDHLLQVGGLECGVTDAARFDHGSLPHGVRVLEARRESITTASSTQGRQPA
jgi:hypothetical protein